MPRMGRPVTSSKSAAPYKLRAILLRHKLEHGSLRARLRFSSGKRSGQEIAPATLSTLLTRRVWPVTIEADEIKRVTAEFLRAHGVPEEEIEQAWVIDGVVDDQARPSSPRRARQNANSEPSEPPFLLPESEMLSPATREHFGLARHPFMDDVQGPQDVYLSKDQRYIRESMHYAAKNSGLIAVIGESGSGKSTLRRDLVERIRRDNEKITMIQPQTVDKTQLTAAHICDAIINDLSKEAPKVSLELKARQIQRILTESARVGNNHVLIIEEAHDLTNATLKYLKRFWEMEDGYKKLIGIVIVGQPELSDRLNEQRNPDLREFIRRCEVATLKSLNGNLEEYLTLKFKRVGKRLDEIFEKDAFDAVRARLTRVRPNTQHVESHLYPLVVQNLIVKAMNQAVELGLAKISGELIGRV